MIYVVRTFFVAARRGKAGGACICSGRPLVFVPLELMGPMNSGRQEKNLVLCSRSLSHLFTLILFEPTRRGQSLGRWNVDPVYAALLWTVVRAFRSYDLLGRR
jgi:hypothetical protein